MNKYIIISFALVLFFAMPAFADGSIAKESVSDSLARDVMVESSQVGSVINYDHLFSRKIVRDYHRMIHDDWSGHYWIIGFPKEGEDKSIHHYLVWINKSNMLPTKYESYDRDWTLLKLVEVWEVKMVGSRPHISKAIIKDLEGRSESSIDMVGTKMFQATDISLFPYFVRQSKTEWSD